MRANEIPILVIAFNRPDHTQKLLQTLSDQSVRQIYVSIDGPRSEGEKVKCEQVLSVVKSFSRTMRITVVYRSRNLGCAIGVTSALDWFFSRVDFGIVLEDDCIPENGFLDYFEDYFLRIKDFEEQGVSMATAHNPLRSIARHTVSRYFLIHGWATTKRNWETVRKDFFRTSFPRFSNDLGDKRSIYEGIFWWANATRARLGSVDTWDSMFCDRMWKLGRKSLIPKMNMIENIGFGGAATHTKDAFGSIFLDLNPEIIEFMELDDVLRSQYFKIRPRHAITPLVKVAIDFPRFLLNSRLEKKLTNDLSFRTEAQLS